MKRLIVIVFGLMASLCCVYAQSDLNASADNILGVYSVNHQGESTKVRVTKTSSGTYTAQVFWVQNRLDENGNVRLDEKNPDKSLRNVPCDKIIIIDGMSYDSDKQRWTDAKVYDPIRGIRANVTCRFTEDGRLQVKGSLMGFSQSIYWKKIQ